MTDGSRACPGCGDLVVMVAVKCLQCGALLGTNHGAHDDHAAHAPPQPQAVVYEVAAQERRPVRRLPTRPAMRALPRPLPGTSTSFRMDVSFNPPSRTQAIRKVLETCPSDLAPGTHVEVRNRFNERWTGGFVVEAEVPGGYRVRRTWNGALLPVTFKEDDLRPVQHAPA
jgi:hypothetical protein